jgi:hypothetical protein
VTQIELYDESGRVGILTFSDDRLSFQGDPDEAAKAFFEAFNQVFSSELQQAYITGWTDALKEKVN